MTLIFLSLMGNSISSLMTRRQGAAAAQYNLHRARHARPIGAHSFQLLTTWSMSQADRYGRPTARSCRHTKYFLTTYVAMSTLSYSNFTGSLLLSVLTAVRSRARIAMGILEVSRLRVV